MTDHATVVSPMSRQLRDPVAEAYETGREARRRSAVRSSSPFQFVKHRDRDRAWTRGWKDEDARVKPLRLPCEGCGGFGVMGTLGIEVTCTDCGGRGYIEAGPNVVELEVRS